MSELLRVEESHDEVAEEKDGNEEDDRRGYVHGLSQLLACGDVEEGDREKGD
jgi:hypothetical protein